VKKVRLLNPNGLLLPELAARLRRYRKTTPVWAKVIKTATIVETPEGPKDGSPGDMLCRGIKPVYWREAAAKFNEEYESTDHCDQEGFTEYRLKPDATLPNASPGPAPTNEHHKQPPVWAKAPKTAMIIDTPDGPLDVMPGDMLCRRGRPDFWPQPAEKFDEKYEPTGEFDREEFQKYRPKPNATLRDATTVDFAFQVDHPKNAPYSGQPGDYVVRSISDLRDIWVVAADIFKETHELVSD
jgi:hypothetical protein